MLASHGAMAASKPTISASVQKPLLAAQAAVKIKDWPTAKAAVEDAKKASDHKPFDDYNIARVHDDRRRQPEG